jgi:single-stranded-DNA-specific exonuclease
MDRIVSLIREAIGNGTRIMIFGDYDADGICAAAILTETLQEEGADVIWRLPSRHAEGYGLNETAVREAAHSCGLLITVDCGIASTEEVALAKSLGLTVIVTDHHTLPETLPAADAVTSPLLGGYPCPNLCGAGVALKICQALQGMAGMEKRLDLAAIATVADVVPLLDENRIIVAEGLKRIESSVRPGLQALLRVSATNPPLRADHLAFRIGPRLNAAGRLESADIAEQLLLTQDPEEAEILAHHLEDLNGRRQQMERATTTEADQQAKARGDFDTSRVLVVSGEGWNPGLIGLTAGRLCERYHRPAVALSISGDTATGSCRSVPGINIFDMLKACGDLLERYGGHAQAAGLTVRTENIDAFREKLDRVIRENCDPACFDPVKEYDLELPFRTWTPAALTRLARLEPSGCGNPPPVFMLTGVSVQAMRRVGKDMSHLQMQLLSGDTILKGIGFSMGAAADTGWQEIDILYKPVLNEFRGKISVEAQVTALRPSN